MPKRASAAASVRRGRLSRCVNELCRPRPLGPRRADQVDHAARDRRRRIEERHRPGRQPREAVEQQRVMRAGEHDGVGAAPVAVDEAGRDLGRDRRISGRRAVELGLGVGGEPRRADQRHLGAVAEVADQRAGVFARHRGLGAEHRHALARGRRAGRLDRRHGADERHREARAQIRQHQRRRGVAGDHHERRMMRVDQRRHQRDDPLDQRRLAVGAVGKERVVGDVDEARIRACRRDLAMDGEAAQPGIKHKDRRRARHTHDARNSYRASRSIERGKIYAGPSLSGAKSKRGPSLSGPKARRDQARPDRDAAVRCAAAPRPAVRARAAAPA